MTPAVSIVIRAFNEERYIGRLLDLIAGQTIRDPEIIVVDSGSFDRTREVVAGRVRLVRIEPADFTFGYSLNVGIRAATAPLAAIVSAHTEPTDEHWLESLVRPFDDEDVAMVYGRQIGDARSKFSERLDFVRTFGGSRRRMSAADALPTTPTPPCAHSVGDLRIRRAAARARRHCVGAALDRARAGRRLRAGRGDPAHPSGELAASAAPLSSRSGRGEADWRQGIRVSVSGTVGGGRADGE